MITAQKSIQQQLQSKSFARSLAISRFVDLPSNGEGTETTRRRSCERIQKGQTNAHKLASWHEWLLTLAGNKSARFVAAKLQYRMIINSGGSALENGGLCLDRISGVPYIPGSAIKGAARRMAIQELLECDSVEEKTKKLTQIARVFGWGTNEWKSGRNRNGQPDSDFWWAMAQDDGSDPNELDQKRNEYWEAVEPKVKDNLLTELSHEKFVQNYAGSLCFLPAYPEKDPGIDLDIVTCHHPDYYKGERESALDDEDPNPVVFTCVSADKQPRFIFPVLSHPRQSAHEDVETASQWLRHALEIFGIGGKTNAGYGWFVDDSQNYSDELEKRVKEKRQKEIEAEEEAKKSPYEKAKDNIANMAKMDEQAFADYAKALENKSTEEQQAFLEVLKRSELKTKRKNWQKRKPQLWEPCQNVAKTLNIDL